MREARARLSALVAAAEAGEEVVITRGAQPVVRLVALGEPTPARRFGALAGKISVAESFFDPLTDDELGSIDG